MEWFSLRERKKKKNRQPSYIITITYSHHTQFLFTHIQRYSHSILAYLYLVRLPLFVSFSGYVYVSIIFVTVAHFFLS